MIPLLHALANLARLRWLGAAFCALAMLCVTTHASALAGATAHVRIDASASADITTTASASEAAQTKDRVWGFDQNSPLHVWSLRSASAETHLGFSPTLPETASASSYAAEGGERQWVGQQWSSSLPWGPNGGVGGQYVAGVGYTNYGGRLGALASRIGIRKPFLAYERLEINAALRAPQYESTLAGVVRHEGKHMALANNHINLKQLQYSRIPGVPGVAAWFDEGLAYGAEMGTGFAPYRAFSSMTAIEKAHFWGAVGFGGLVAGGTAYVVQ